MPKKTDKNDIVVVIAYTTELAKQAAHQEYLSESSNCASTKVYWRNKAVHTEETWMGTLDRGGYDKGEYYPIFLDVFNSWKKSLKDTNEE